MNPRRIDSVTRQELGTAQRPSRGRRLVAVTAVMAWLGSFVPIPAANGLDTPVALTNATVVTESGTGGALHPLKSAVVLIVDGRIANVGTDVTIPPHARRIDATGLFVYPGLIDAQTHLGIPETVRTQEQRQRTEDVNPDHSQGPLAATRFANRRGIRPQFRAREIYEPEEKDLEAHRGAGFTAALLAPRDGILSGTSDLMALSDAPIRRSILLPDAAMHASFAAGEDGDYPRSVLGVIAQFRQVMLDAQWHVRIGRFARRHPSTAPRTPSDPALDALQPVLGRAQRIVFEANTENEIRRALNLADEFNLDVIISGAKEAWKVIPRIKQQRIPLIVSLKFDDEPEYGKKKSRPKSRRPENEVSDEDGESDDQAKSPDKKDKDDKKIYEPLKIRRERRRRWEEQVANVVRLHEAGLTFSLRTRGFEKLGDFWKNLRLVIERGLPKEAALAALTASPATTLRASERLGAIRRGKLANLTVTTEPLFDKEAKVKWVFIDGKKFEIDTDKKETPSPRGRRAGGPRRRGRPEITESAVQPEDDDDVEADIETTGEPTEDKGPTWAAEIKADRIPKTQTGGDLLIRGATVIPVTSPTLTNASILVRNGKIEAIGAIDEVPDGVTVIDGTGRFVMPGIVDCHSHLGADGVNEGTLAITAEVRVADVINPDSVGIFRAVAGGTTSHHVLHGSANPIGGQNAIVKLKYGRSAEEMLVADAPPTIKFALGENVTHANSQRSAGKRFPNSRMGVEAVIRTALEAAKHYQASWIDYETHSAAGGDRRPPRRDLRLEALARILSGEFTVHAHCYRSDEILRLLATAEEYGFRIGTLQHVLEGYRVAPELARHGCGASTFSNFWAYKIEAFGAIAQNAALMTEKGVNVSLNSDSPNTIRRFGLEAAKSVRWGGLDENQALRLITINPAMQMRMEDRIGSLEVGKDGDLAVFNGHPLNTFAKCVMTIIEGEVYFEDSRPDPVEPAYDLQMPGDVDPAIPQTPHRAFAITNATIHPISGPVIEDGTVVILEDEIHAVGKTVAVPPGAGVLDAKGRHVYPGLIDAGTGLGLTEIGSLRSTRDSSDIARFAPHLRASSAIHPHSAHIRITRTGGTTTALSAPSGGRIFGQSAVIQLDGWTTPQMLVEDDVALHMTVPSKPVHARPRRGRRRRGGQPPDHDKTLRELEAFMERAKHYATVKTLSLEDPEVALEVDLALEAMIPYVRGEKPVVFSAHSYKHILDIIDFAEKHKLRCVLSGATQAWKLADTLAEKDIPVILGTPLSYPGGEFEPWDSVYRCAGDLARAGVRFCFASQSAAGAYNLPVQAGMAVAHGLPKDAAEYALTLGAAQILGIADRVGSIEVGKKADLIVTTDTPLQTVSRVTHMFIDGRPIELTSLHTEVYEKFKHRPAPELGPVGELKGPPSLTGR